MSSPAVNPRRRVKQPIHAWPCVTVDDAVHYSGRDAHYRFGIAGARIPVIEHERMWPCRCSAQVSPYLDALCPAPMVAAADGPKRKRTSKLVSPIGTGTNDESRNADFCYSYGVVVRCHGCGLSLAACVWRCRTSAAAPTFTTDQNIGREMNHTFRKVHYYTFREPVAGAPLLLLHACCVAVTNRAAIARTPLSSTPKAQNHMYSTYMMSGVVELRHMWTHYRYSASERHGFPNPAQIITVRTRQQRSPKTSQLSHTCVRSYGTASSQFRLPRIGNPRALLTAG
jgi:hypothetical protein